jgi:hypothetical protein
LPGLAQQYLGKNDILSEGYKTSYSIKNWAAKIQSGKQKEYFRSKFCKMIAENYIFAP